MVDREYDLRLSNWSVSVLSIVSVAIGVIGWSPRQELAYLAPFLILMFWLMGTRTRASNLIGLLVYLSFFLLLEYFIGVTSDNADEYYVRYLLWIVTHGSLLVIIVGYSLGGNQKSIIFFINLLIFTALIESLVGIVQYSSGPGFSHTGAAGDYVIGTLGSNSHLFALKMILSASMSFIMWKKNNRSVYFLAGISMTVAWMLASAMHTVIVILCALVAFLIFKNVDLLKRLKIAVILIVMGAISSIVFLSIYSNAYIYVKNKLAFENIRGDTFGKVEYMKRTLVDLPKHNGYTVLVTGVGPGNYSSRASWMLSGEYLKSQKYLPIVPSNTWKLLQYDIWNKDLLEELRWAHGVANQPFSTWFTIIGEMGWVIALALLGAFLKIIMLFRDIGRKVEEISWLMDIGIITSCILFFSLFFDNWLEYPRLILPVVFLLSLLVKYAGLLRKPRYFIQTTT